MNKIFEDLIYIYIFCLPRAWIICVVYIKGARYSINFLSLFPKFDCMIDWLYISNAPFENIHSYSIAAIACEWLQILGLCLASVALSRRVFIVPYLQCHMYRNLFYTNSNQKVIGMEWGNGKCIFYLICTKHTRVIRVHVPVLAIFTSNVIQNEKPRVIRHSLEINFTVIS